MNQKDETQNKKLTLSMWLEVNFLDWQAENKKRATLQEFAEYIGYSRPLISMWMTGQRLPTEDGVKRLAELFGPDVYDILEMPRPNPHLQNINRLWEFLPEDVQIKIEKEVEKYETQNEISRFQKSSKARKIVKPK
jgi:transcriptional regulator with XRE-family HTH domain